ncbi:hypothetical protein [Staphylococcus lutrae]|nr:hypothetical protein [Staphylococcus lutrae]
MSKINIEIKAVKRNEVAMRQGFTYVERTQKRANMLMTSTL